MLTLKAGIGTLLIGILLYSVPALAMGASADVQGECDEATATALGEEYGLNPFAPATTAMSPICGEFLGPGIEAMIARAIPATCGGYFGWAAFSRQPDGSWKLVWRYKNGQADLQAIGDDLEETNQVLGPHDVRCAGEKTTKTRIWHWDGQRFVAGPWSIHPKPSILAPSFFLTVRGSGIFCTMADSPKIPTLPGHNYHNGVSCISFGRFNDQHAVLRPNGTVRSCRNHGRRHDCIYPQLCGCGEDDISVHVGEQMVVGRYACRIRRRSVKCLDEAGAGFVISPRKVRRLT